jgi:lipid-A-disaccharide synthase-like uncharacterized protein
MRIPFPAAWLLLAAVSALAVGAAAPDAPAVPRSARTDGAAQVCSRCNVAISADWRFCPECGKRQPAAGTVRIALFGHEWYVLPGDLAWLAVGVTGQLLFAGRFFLQWLASEREGRSVVPAAFWYMSLVGGLMVLVYGIKIREVVVILSQAFNPIIYLRNIVLLHRAKAAGQEPPAIKE